MKLFRRLLTLLLLTPPGILASFRLSPNEATTPIELFKVDLVRRKPPSANVTSSGASKPMFYYSKTRQTGCKCGKKPFVDDLYPIFNLHYRRDRQWADPLIIGGSEADVYEFPWMVAIADTSYPRSKLSCGGVLINSLYVLTAAHCLKKKYILWTEVWFNVHDKNKVKTDENVSIRKVKRFIFHPKYPQWNMEHDIALIELMQPIDFTTSLIRPVCLPSSNSDDFAGQLGTVAGWGSTTADAYGTNPSTLHKVQVPILSHFECTRTFHFTSVKPTMLCAGDLDGGKDACYSDSGGPLIVETENRRNILVGIVAWGRGCGRKNLPGVYTRVSSYLKWILAAARRGEWCQRLNNKFLQHLQQ